MFLSRDLRPYETPISAGPPGVNASLLERDASVISISVRSTVFVLLYVALDAVSFVFPYQPLPVTPWNPNAGLAIAVIVLGGLRYVPAVLLAALISELPLRADNISPVANIVGGIGLGACYSIIGMVVRRIAPAATLERLHDLRRFTIVVVAGTALSAACYVQFNLPASGLPVATHVAAFFRMWVGDLTGTLGTAPVLFLIERGLRGGGSEDAASTRIAWARDLAVFLIVLSTLLGLIFGLEPIEGHKLFYLLFVPLIALAMRRGFSGAAIGVAIVQLALIGVLLVTDRSAQSASEFQLLMLVLALTTLLLGAVTSERNRALVELERRGVEMRAQQSALADALRVAAASEMASALAHELAQPLSAIGSYARAGLEMLRLGTATPGELTRALERVERETARSGKTVRRIRDFFRSGASQFEPLDVESVVLDAVSTLRDRLEATGAAVSTNIASDLPRVFADRVQIGTVLHNLLANALDAATPATSVTIAISAFVDVGNFVAIDVSDSGSGIAASIRESLFEPLSTTKPAGMGLGLAISRTIVQAHGGQLVLLDQDATTFRATLPVHVASET